MQTKRMNKWKTGFLALLCFAVTACSSGSPTGDNPKGDSGPANGAGNGKTVVTMTVMTKTRFLEEAEQKFENEHPDIDIQIEESVPLDPNANVMKGGSAPADADSGPSSEEVEKYINGVNTAIMSSKAADILSVEHLPVDKYTKTGLLADWNELASADAEFNKSDYYENVFKGISDGTKWYGIPTSFTLSLMVGDNALLEQHGLKDATWTWDQFVELLEQLGNSGDGKVGLAMIKPAELLAYLTETVYEQLIARDGSSVQFDKAAFQGYMEKVNALFASGLATTDPITPGSASFTQIDMPTPVELALLPQMFGGENGQMLRPPAAGEDEGIPFKSDQVLALNAKSQVKEEAWKFVRFLLSEEMQSSEAQRGFAVHKESMRNSMVNIQEMLSGNGTAVAGRGGSGGMELTDEQIEEVLNVIPSISKYTNSDVKVLNLIREESEAYFSGSKSAEAVADLLANRITTYLNE